MECRGYGLPGSGNGVQTRVALQWRISAAPLRATYTPPGCGLARPAGGLLASAGLAGGGALLGALEGAARDFSAAAAALFDLAFFFAPSPFFLGAAARGSSSSSSRPRGSNDDDLALPEEACASALRG